MASLTLEVRGLREEKTRLVKENEGYQEQLVGLQVSLIAGSCSAQAAHGWVLDPRADARWPALACVQETGALVSVLENKVEEMRAEQTRVREEAGPPHLPLHKHILVAVVLTPSLVWHTAAGGAPA